MREKKKKLPLSLISVLPSAFTFCVQTHFYFLKTPITVSLLLRRPSHSLCHTLSEPQLSLLTPARRLLLLLLLQHCGGICDATSSGKMEARTFAR